VTLASLDRMIAIARDAGAAAMRYYAVPGRIERKLDHSPITDADRALALVLGQLDQLCAKDDADQLMGRLLRQFNAVTGLSGWSDPRQLH